MAHPVPVTLNAVVLDTDEPLRLAQFYADLLGWRISSEDSDWVTISDGHGHALAFQLAPAHIPPTWPDERVRQQAHLDFDVDDLDAGSAWAVSLGARPINWTEGATFRPFLDPSGHPFCLCLA